MKLLLASAIAVVLLIGGKSYAVPPLAPYPTQQGNLITTRPATQPDNPDFQRGLVNIQAYGATANDGTDDTAAIQAALYDAYIHHLVCYFPTGTYDVSDTLDCEQAADNRKYTYMLLGQKGNPVGNRPVIRLMPDSNGFDDTANPKPVLKMWARIHPSAPLEEFPGMEKPGTCFNNVVKGIDIDASASGNPGAAGIYFAGAQGCSAEDIRMNMTNGYSGFLKSMGVNGGYYNIEIEGGRYGIYIKSHNDPVNPSKSIGDTFPIFAGCRFYNQTHRAVYTKGRCPITFVGFHIKKTSAPVFESLNNFHEQGGNLAFFHGVIELTNNGLGIDNDYSGKSRSIYMKDVYLKNINPIVNNASPSNSVAGTSGGWTQVIEYGRALTGMSKIGRNLINGAQGAETPDISTTRINRNFAAGSVPSADSLIAHHIWDEATFPAFDDNDTYDAVVDGGLDKTGVTDVTTSLNNILAANDKVFLPKGIYNVSGTITIPGDTQLFGISRTFSIIRPDTDPASPSPWDPSSETYIITTDDNPNAKPLLAWVWLDFTHLSPGEMISLIHWRAGRGSMIRNIFAWDGRWGSGPGQTNGFNALDKKLYKFTGSAGGRIYGLTNGWQNTALSSPHDNFRAIYVEGTTEPLNFYGYNVERQLGIYQSEFRNAANIGVFGAKTEGENPKASLIGREDLRPMIGIVNCDNIIIGTVATSVIGCKEGWLKVIDSTNVLCTTITTQNHGDTIDLIQEVNGVNTHTVSAKTYSVLGTFKRGEATLMNFSPLVLGSNLVSNPGFEDTGNSTIGPWILCGHATALATTYNPNSGNRSLKNFDNTLTANVEQTIPVNAGASYTVSGSIRVNGSGTGSGSILIQFLNDATPLTSHNITGNLDTTNTSWQQFWKVVQADATATHMLIQCVNDTEDLPSTSKTWFDDISVKEHNP